MNQAPKSDAPGRSERRRPRWHLLYYVLALFDVCAVCVSLWFHHRIMQIYTQSVETNRQWVEIWRSASELSELAASIDAPGNDLFESHDAEQESAKVEQAHRTFKQRLVEVTSSLLTQPPSERIQSMLDDLKTARSTTLQMVRDAHLTFRYYAAHDHERATAHMAMMDRRFSTVNSTLVRLRSRIGSLQNDHFATQTAAAALLQRGEYLIAGLITLMIAGAALYGRLIAKQVAIANRSEDVYRSELEQRVAERTADLTTANRDKDQLLRQLMTAQEDERRSIARDLHDGVGQALTYLFVSLRNLTSAEDLPSARDQATKLAELTSQSLDDVRRLARGLRPSVLDDLGLRPAVEHLLGELALRHHWTTAIEDVSPPDWRLSEVQETGLYRMIQESLTNIAKHAQATRVTLEFDAAADWIDVCIRDNGRGFSESREGRLSMGLSSLRERAHLLGGSAEIKSSPGQGTTVRLRLPRTTH